MTYLGEQMQSLFDGCPGIYRPLSTEISGQMFSHSSGK